MRLKNKMKNFLDAEGFLCKYDILNFKTESMLAKVFELMISLRKRRETSPQAGFETVHLTSSSHLRLGVRTLEPHSKDIGSNPIDGAL